MMSDSNKESFITILSPMVTKLQLNGNELVIFALINGFSQNKQGWFTGSLEYITKWSNTTKSTACLILDKLVDKGLLKKKQRFEKGIKYCMYQTNYSDILNRMDEENKYGEDYYNPLRKSKRISHCENRNDPLRKSKRPIAKIETNIDSIYNNKEIYKERKANAFLKSESKKIDFNEFWNLYDKKIERKSSEKKWNKLPLKTQKEILEYIPKYKKAQPDKKYRKNPCTFFNQESWNDEIIEENGTKQLNKKASTMLEDRKRNYDFTSFTD